MCKAKLVYISGMCARYSFAYADKWRLTEPCFLTKPLFSCFICLGLLNSLWNVWKVVCFFCLFHGASVLCHFGLEVVPYFLKLKLPLNFSYTVKGALCIHDKRCALKTLRTVYCLPKRLSWFTLVLFLSLIHGLYIGKCLVWLVTLVPVQFSPICYS